MKTSNDSATHPAVRISVDLEITSDSAPLSNAQLNAVWNHIAGQAGELGEIVIKPAGTRKRPIVVNVRSTGQREFPSYQALLDSDFDDATR